MTAATPSPQSKSESDANAHRDYLLAQTGLPADIALPVARKGKTTKTTGPKPKNKVETAVNVEGNGDGAETPRNAGPPKLKITLKRKASEALVTSSGSPNSDESKYDSIVDKTPKTKKSAGKKRKLSATENATAPASALDDDNPTTPATPSTKKPATKKRKAPAVEDTVTSSSPDAKEEDEAAAPPNKKAKRVSTKSKDTAAPKTARKGKGKKSVNNTDDDLPPPSAPAREELNFTVAAKVKRVQEFITAGSGAEGQSLDFIQRDPENPYHISVPELTLVGALMRMRVDYEIGDPHMAQLSDAESVILKRFPAPGLQTSDQPWVTIDARKRTALEETIQEKIAGHGLEGYSLLDIELELLCRANPPDPPAKVSAPAELQAFYDQTYKKVLDDIAKNNQARIAADIAATVANERGMLEIERNRGVCPLPMA